MKTRFVAYVASSIDGRISFAARKQPDWTSKEDWKFFQASIAKADAVIVGRNTYLAVKERLDRRRTFVLTSRVRKASDKGSVTFVNPKKVSLKDLFKPFRTVATLGGAGVYQLMLDQGLMDELFVTVEPLIFGRGTPMFDGGKKTSKLKLLSIRKLNKRGTLLLRYRSKA